MEVETKRLFYNQTTDRVLVEIKSGPCTKKTIEARAALVEILAACVNNQNLLHCDAELMEKASITHDGFRWVLRTEALVLKRMEL